MNSSLKSFKKRRKAKMRSASETRKKTKPESFVPDSFEEKTSLVRTFKHEIRTPFAANPFTKNCKKRN